MNQGSATSTKTAHYVRAAAVEDVQAAGCLPVQVSGHTLALFAVGEKVYALDNRCPHMGFPLHRGTVKDGILTCHWHHARFDMESGGTFDEWADDVRAFPTEIRDGQVWVDMTPAGVTVTSPTPTKFVGVAVASVSFGSISCADAVGNTAKASKMDTVRLVRHPIPLNIRMALYMWL